MGALIITQARKHMQLCDTRILADRQTGGQAGRQALRNLSFASRVIPVHSYVVIHSEHVVLLELAARQQGRRQLSGYQGLAQWEEGGREDSERNFAEVKE